MTSSAKFTLVLHHLAYVALSRATSMETLQVLNFDKSK